LLKARRQGRCERDAAKAYALECPAHKFFYYGRNAFHQISQRGDNGSAFFSGLHQKKKSVMAETLVGDLCEHRPPLPFGRLFIGTRLEDSERTNRLGCATIAAHAALYFRCILQLPWTGVHLVNETRN
jgi:hypothetical protein